MKDRRPPNYNEHEEALRRALTILECVADDAPVDRKQANEVAAAGRRAIVALYRNRIRREERKAR